MDLRTLRFFAAVADHSGFSRAAEQLGISQPALSRQISALERELRVKLFDRVGRQTTLTAAGENLLERARSLLHDADAIKSHAHEIAGGSYGALWLGATPQSIESFVAKLLARFCARTPNVEISILEDGAANLVEATQRGLIHVAIASLPAGTELSGRPLFPCAVERRRFPVGANPTRQPLQPEAIGAVMEVTKWLKPSISVSRYTVTARVCRP